MLQNSTLTGYVVLALLTALVVSFLLTPAVKSFAYKVGAVDVPKDARRMHKVPIPRLGGLAIFMGFMVSILLFTRVQNTGSHQFLLFLPGYFILFLLGAAALAEGITRHRNLKLGCWAFVLVLSMSVRCSPLTTLAVPGFVIEHFPIQIPATRYFISLDKLIYDRKDIGQIRAPTTSPCSSSRPNTLSPASPSPRRTSAAARCPSS